MNEDWNMLEVDTKWKTSRSGLKEVESQLEDFTIGSESKSMNQTWDLLKIAFEVEQSTDER